MVVYLFLRVFVYIVYIYFNLVLKNFNNLSIFMKSRSVIINGKNREEYMDELRIIRIIL